MGVEICTFRKAVRKSRRNILKSGKKVNVDKKKTKWPMPDLK